MTDNTLVRKNYGIRLDYRTLLKTKNSSCKSFGAGVFHDALPRLRLEILDSVRNLWLIGPVHAMDKVRPFNGLLRKVGN